MKTVEQIAKEAAESVFTTIEDGAVSLESASKAIEGVLKHYGVRPTIVHEINGQPITDRRFTWEGVDIGT